MTNGTAVADGFRTGFIALIGRPNVGKSTLMNRLIGMKVAITSGKPQTTRGRIRTIVTCDDCQMIFLDSPGIHKPANRLGERMMKIAGEVKRDADVILWLLEARADIGEEEQAIGEELAHVKQPVIIVLNKTDGLEAQEVRERTDRTAQAFPFALCMAVSALRGEGIDALRDALRQRLPYGEALYDEDALTDMPEREIVAEIVREKALRFLDDEVPHGIAVMTETMHYREKKAAPGQTGATICDIRTVIVCEKESHKGIIIGKNGRKLKEIGKAARLDIEKLLDCPVNLQIFVKVRSNWRDDVRQLKNFGLWTEG